MREWTDGRNSVSSRTAPTDWGDSMGRGIANMPGIGGSLGMCALCGDGFMFEILMGKSVRTIEIAGMDKDVCVHDKCLTVLEANGPDWHSLPEGPLRRAYARAANEDPPAVDAVGKPPSVQPDSQRAS